MLTRLLWQSYRSMLSEYWANNESVRRALIKLWRYIWQVSHKIIDKVWWSNSMRIFLLQGTTGNGERCKWSLQSNKDIKSSIPYHKKNSIEGYRSLIFRSIHKFNYKLVFSLVVCKVFSGMVCLVNSGDHDMLTPYIGTQDWIRSLNYSIINKWRPWMILDQVAGYI